MRRALRRDTVTGVEEEWGRLVYATVWGGIAETGVVMTTATAEAGEAGEVEGVGGHQRGKRGDEHQGVTRRIPHRREHRRGLSEGRGPTVTTHEDRRGWGRGDGGSGSDGEKRRAESADRERGDEGGTTSRPTLEMSLTDSEAGGEGATGGAAS